MEYRKLSNMNFQIELLLSFNTNTFLLDLYQIHVFEQLKENIFI